MALQQIGLVYLGPIMSAGRVRSRSPARRAQDGGMAALPMPNIPCLPPMTEQTRSLATLNDLKEIGDAAVLACRNTEKVAARERVTAPASSGPDAFFNRHDRQLARTGGTSARSFRDRRSGSAAPRIGKP